MPGADPRQTPEERGVGAPLAGGTGRHGWLKALILVASTAAVFVLLLWKADLGEVLRSFRGARWDLLAVATAVALLVRFVLVPDKWRRALAFMGCPVPLGEMVFLVSASLPLQLITPAKSGSLLATVYLSRRHGLPPARGVSSMLLMRALNLGVLTGIVFVVAALDQLLDAGSTGSSVTAHLALTAGSLLVVLALVWTARRPFLAWLDRRLPRLGALVADLLAAFGELSPRQLAWLFLYAAAALAVELAGSFCIFRALDVPVGLLDVYALTAAVIIASNLPLTIGGLGTREAATVLLFAPFASPEVLLAAGAAISAVGYILPAILGLAVVGPYLRRLAR